MATTAVLSRFGASDRAQLAADAGRLIERLRKHGGGPNGGVTRLVYSPEWQAAMADIEEWLLESGLAVRHDAVGSRVGRLEGESPSVVLSGSHTDPVKQGGVYDGTPAVGIAGCAIGWLLRNMGNIGRARVA